MEVSVSPRATTCVVPLAGDGCADSLVVVAAFGAGTGLVSPITVPGREACCSSFKMCWESASILVLSSSIFLSSEIISPGAEEGCGVWANAAATWRKKTAQRARDFIPEIFTSESRTGKHAAKARRVGG